MAKNVFVIISFSSVCVLTVLCLHKKVMVGPCQYAAVGIVRQSLVHLYTPDQSEVFLWW